MPSPADHGGGCKSDRFGAEAEQFHRTILISHPAHQTRLLETNAAYAIRTRCVRDL